MSTRILVSWENFFYTLRVHLNCSERDSPSRSLKNVPIPASSKQPEGQSSTSLGVGEWNFAVRRRAKLEVTSATGLPVGIY